LFERAVIRRVLFLEGLQPEKDMAGEDVEFPERRKCFQWYILLFDTSSMKMRRGGRANKEKEPVTAYHAFEEHSTTPVCRE